MAESFVQVAADGLGKQVDTFTVVDALTLLTKHRQAVVIGDPLQAGQVVGVSNGSLSVTDALNAEGETGYELLKLILIELRVLTHLVASEFRVRDDLAAMRADPTIFIA